MINTIKPLILSLFFFSLYSIEEINSQSNRLGTWNLINLKYTYNEKISFFGESQLRSLKFYDQFHYYEYKGGINYKLNNAIQLTLGAGSYQTYKEGGNFITPKNNDEFRLWPQLILSQALGKIKIEQRYRSEFRFRTSGYRNRFRYRFGLSYPFGKEKNNYKPFQIIANNELFFTNNEPYFERNRLQLAISYKLTKTSTLQLGYIHQFDYRINDETGKDFLQVGYFVEFQK